MAGKLTEQQKLERKFRRDIVKPLEEIVGTIGGLEAELQANAVSELEIADAVMLSLQQSFRDFAAPQIDGPKQTLRQLRDSLNIYTSGQLAMVGEQVAGTPVKHSLANSQSVADPLGYVAPQTTTVAPAPTSASTPCLKPQQVTVTANAPSLPPPPPTTPQTTPQPSQPPPETPQPPSSGSGGPPEKAVPTIGQDCDVDRYVRVQQIAAELVGPGGSSGSNIISNILGSLTGFALDNAITAAPINIVISAVMVAIETIIGKSAEQIKAMEHSTGCASDTLSALTTISGILRSLDKYLPLVPNRITNQLTYAENALCPTGYPQVDQAIAAYLGNEIGESTLRTWLAQQDYCWEPIERFVKSQRAKPSPLELAALRRRGKLSISEYDSAMRSRGFLEQRDRNNLFDLTEYVPGPQDLIRFMVRDSADDQLWQKYGGDEILARKWVGDVKKWGDYQGISQDVAKQYWRAHWSIPSPGQLFEFYHRLRHRPEFGGPAKVLQDVKDALTQQDILPYWIDAYLAISFRPLTRVDVRRAYDIGSLTKQDVESSYIDLGYSDKNAAILADFAERLRNNRIWNERAIKQWKSELITVAEARNQLAALDYPQDFIDRAIDVAAKQQRNHSAVKRFGKGQLTRQHANDALTAHGIPAAIFNPWLDEAANLLRNSPPVKYFARDIIDRAEAERRLTAYGIEPERFKFWLDDAAAARPNQYAIAQYRKGHISTDEARNRLTADGVPAGRTNQLIDRAKNEIVMETRAVCADALVDRFLHGEFGEPELNAKLIGIGVPPDFAEEIVNRARCKQSALGKMPSTNELCNWLEMGLLTPVQFVDRLIRLGWTDADAANVLVSCMSKINTKQAKEAAKQAKDDEAARKKAEQQLARSAQAIERLRDKQAKAAEAARKAKERREKQMLDIADKLAKITGLALSDAMSIVRAEKSRVQDAYRLSIDDSIAAVIRGVESADGSGEPPLMELVNDAAESIIAAQAEVAESNGMAS